MVDLRYPIGRFQRPERLSADERATALTHVAELPRRMRRAIAGLSEQQLGTPYRPEGWTVRQVVHHVPDSHLNAYIRFKLALTEDTPTIKPYKEALWAEMVDGRTAPVETSLVLLEALHERWMMVLRGMGSEDFARTLSHPEMGPLTLDQMLALYSWHSRHHVAHITSLREREGWP